MRSRISIRGSVRPYVGPSVGPAFVETLISGTFLTRLDVLSVGKCYKDAQCEVQTLYQLKLSKQLDDNMQIGFEVTPDENASIVYWYCIWIACFRHVSSNGGPSIE